MKFPGEKIELTKEEEALAWSIVPALISLNVHSKGNGSNGEVVKRAFMDAVAGIRLVRAGLEGTEGLRDDRVGVVLTRETPQVVMGSTFPPGGGR